MVAAGLLVPMTGGAVVYAATTTGGRPAARSSTSDDTNTRTRHAIAAPARPSVRPTASPSASSSTSTGTLAPDMPRLGFTPYADLLAWPPLDLTKTADLTHVKNFTMGFVSAGGGCSATWGGLTPLADLFAEHRLKSVPGRTTIAFGGPHGTELARSCTNVDDLTERYKAVVDATHPDGVDFFLTEAGLSDSAAATRRAQALTRLQHDAPGLGISITLPLHRSGLSDDALAMLRSASSAGLGAPLVNLIPADGKGQSLTGSATAAHAQLQRLYRQSDAQTWQRMGVTPVIGVDGGGTGFQPADAERVLAWAQQHGLGRLSMWSITRDAPCTVDTTAANDTCSGLDEDAGVFSKIFEHF